MTSWKHTVRHANTDSRFAKPFTLSRAHGPDECINKINPATRLSLRKLNLFPVSAATESAVKLFDDSLKVSPMAHVTSITPRASVNVEETILEDLRAISREGTESIGRNRSASEDFNLSSDFLNGVDLGQDEDIMSSRFNVLLVRDQVALKLVVAHIFNAMVGPVIKISKNILKEYIHEVSVHYRPNPFHNFHHAVSVMHFLAVMLNEIEGCEMFSELNLFTLILSALVHDVDHPGKTNLFEINSGSALALVYNDLSVLENHHCSMSFKLMLKPGTNILSRLTLEQRKEVRKALISNVLATDMSKHSELIQEAKSKAPLTGDLLEPADQVFFSKIFLHCADLSGPTKEFSVAREWAARVTEEFNAQVLVENDLGLPILSFMAAADEKTFLKNEIGFSGFFVAPLWRIVSKLCPQLEFVHNQLENNINTYKALREQKEKEEYASASQTDV